MGQEEYIRVKPVERERLADYLERAKGFGRTMKQFAEECGVNPSTFSRIANKKLGGASTEAVIRSIFEHRDPASDITLDMLMDANGFAPAGIVKQAREENEKQYAALLEADRRWANELTNKQGILAQINDSSLERKSLGIIKAGLSIRLPDAVGMLPEHINIAHRIGIRPDLLVKSNQIGGNGLWAFELLAVSRMFNTHMRDRIVKEGAYAVLERVKGNMPFALIRRFIAYTAGAYFCPDKMPQRVSFIVCSLDVYQAILDELDEQKFKDYVSLIYVDLKEEKITEEFVFPRQDGEGAEKFFTLPTPADEEDNMSKLIDIDEIPF